MFMNEQKARSSCLLLCLPNTAVRLCGDVEEREGVANCKIIRKLALALVFSRDHF